MMKNRIIKYCNNLILVSVIFLSACSNEDKSDNYFEVINKINNNLEIKLFDNQLYNVPVRPKKTIILYNSLILPWAKTRGNCIARVSSHNKLEPWIDDLPVVGRLGSPNIELIVKMDPDLVILADNIKGQDKVMRFLKNKGIPILSIRYNSFYDFLEILKLFSVINNSEDATKILIKELKQKVDKTIKNVKQNEKHSALILFASTKNISCELPSGDTGTLLELLDIYNVIQNSPIEDTRRVEISLEKILELNPDMIFVKTMGDIEKIENRIGKELIENKAWAGLKAVKNNRVYYLPKDLFMYKANFRYPEAIEYLANKVYYD